MCDNCSQYWQQNTLTDALHPALDEDQIALYATLKDIKDSAKLQRMMPAWIKAHNRAIAPPKRTKFTPGLPARFPPDLCKTNPAALSFFRHHWA